MFVVGGVARPVSAGTTVGPSGGGVGRFLVDMVKVEEDMNLSKFRGGGACDYLIGAPHSSASPRLLTTMEGFDEEIESILYMCREVSGALHVRKPLQ